MASTTLYVQLINNNSIIDSRGVVVEIGGTYTIEELIIGSGTTGYEGFKYFCYTDEYMRRRRYYANLSDTITVKKNYILEVQIGDMAYAVPIYVKVNDIDFAQSVVGLVGSAYSITLRQYLLEMTDITIPLSYSFIKATVGSNEYTSLKNKPTIVDSTPIIYYYNGQVYSCSASTYVDGSSRGTGSMVLFGQISYTFREILQKAGLPVPQDSTLDVIYVDDWDEYYDIDETYTVSDDSIFDYYFVSSGGSSNLYIFTGGTWKQATPYIFTGGQWKQVTPSIFNGGWK